MKGIDGSDVMYGLQFVRDNNVRDIRFKASEAQDFGESLKEKYMKFGTDIMNVVQQDNI